MSAVLSFPIVFVGILLILRHLMQFRWGRCRSKRDLKGQTVVITGASSGLGEATAIELAKRNAKLIILACRDVVKARKTLEKIVKTTGGRCNVVIRQLDLASFASIRNFCIDFLASEHQLDVLINNAGVGWCPFTLTEDGFETHYGVNHLGHFLLTNLLLDKLTASSRVLVVSSSLYKYGAPVFDVAVENYDAGQAYANSKLANILFVRELARRVSGTGVHVFALSPGMVWTNLGRHRKLSVWQMLLFPFLAVILLRTPFQGCQTVLHCALSEEVEGHSGSFYQNCRRVPLKPIAIDDQAALHLWQTSAKVTHLIP